jgi:ActR/RegA family two-component response regulator
MCAARIIPYEFAWRNSVLLISESEFRRSLRASVLRGHGFQVEVARSVAEARSRWHPNTYAWLLVDVVHQLPGEVLEFCDQIKREDPREKIAFLVGPPGFVSLNWPDEAICETEGSKAPRQFVPKLPRAA